MNRNELVDIVAEKGRVTKKDAGDIVEVVLQTIIDALHDGEEVRLPGFGSFVVKERAARVGINPTTREKIQIPASKAVGFKAAKVFKEQVQ